MVLDIYFNFKEVRCTRGEEETKKKGEKAE